MTGNLPINLHDLLRQRTIEGERVEYKAGWNPQSVLHTICAFANDFHNLGGGYVVLGVEERDGQPLLPPKGLDAGRIEAVLNELLRLGQSAMAPHYHPLTGAYEVEGQTILVLWAPGGETRPYKARVNLARKRRSGPTTFADTAARCVPEGRTSVNCCLWQRRCRSTTGTIRQRRWRICPRG